MAITDRLSDEKFSRPEDRDLGFGGKVASEARERFLNRDGSFNVQRDGLNRFSFINLYHWLLTMPWKKFLGIVTLIYFAINVIFAAGFLLCGADSLADTSNIPFQNSFLRAFFFSVQTFATIGYGTLHPNGFAANFIVTVESLVGMLSQALVTGMLFARFSRPTAKIKFSEVAVIGPYRDQKGFMFRLVNERLNQLFEVEAKILFARFVDENGNKVRRFDLLNLERNRVSLMPLAWTVVHPIDENSPLRNLSEQDLIASETEFLILLSATDETFSQSIYARSSYKPQEVIWNAKFANIYNNEEAASKISIDVKRLSEIEKF